MPIQATGIPCTEASDAVAVAYEQRRVAVHPAFESSTNVNQTSQLLLGMAHGMNIRPQSAFSALKADQSDSAEVLGETLFPPGGGWLCCLTDSHISFKINNYVVKSCASS
jgi:hypothetical protein